MEADIAPGVLTPPHVHQNEDETSYVLEGEITFEVGEQLFHAGPGSIVYKPRGVRHAHWGAGDHPARVLETITSAGFERYFAELGALFTSGGPPAFPEVQALGRRYGVEYDTTRAETLLRRHGLKLPGG